MSLAIGQSAAVNAHGAHSRKTNFGSLVSAINRGDLEAAQNAFAGLSELGPKAPGPLRKGALDAMAKALQEADLDAAKKALKDIQQGVTASATEPVVAPAPATEPETGSSVDILV